MKYKAVFFDRDNTLTQANPEIRQWRDETIRAWSGKPFAMDYDKTMSLFNLAAQGREPWYRNLEDERAFFRRYYRCLLTGEGVTEDIDARADILFDRLWCKDERILYPEVTEVLEYFKAKGYKMGVISDTSPSLELTLIRVGIAKYFTSFTASSLVGAMKPDPIIYNAALAAQGVCAEESLYVDDYKPEADGARELGFTAFLIDRNGKDSDAWSIRSLKEMVEYVEKAERETHA
jgi:HAD superfamily hydrolase (TIGR01509 family)